MLNERCKTCAYYLQTPSIKKVEKAEALLGENAALKARAEKAEHEVNGAWEAVEREGGIVCEAIDDALCEGVSALGYKLRTRAEEAEAKLAEIEKDLQNESENACSVERRSSAAWFLGKHFPDKEPELCGVCGGKRGLCLCLEGTPKHFSGIAERAKKKLPYGGQPEDENEKDG
jgi:hypothetical protein